MIRRRVYVGVVGLGLVAWLVPPVAAAQPPVPMLVISGEASGHPGRTEQAHGSGFPGATRVRVALDKATVAYATSDRAGNWTASFKVPVSALPGTHSVTATTKTAHVTGPFTVRTNWLSVGFGPRHNAANPFENVLSASNVAALKPQWTATPNSDSQSTLQGDVLSGGVIYTSSYDPALPNGVNYAIDAATGKVLWSGGHGNVQDSPAVVGSTLYTDSQDGDIVAQDTATGAIEWTLPAEGSIIGATNGILYTNGPAAIDLATHQYVWQNSVQDETGGAAYDPDLGVVVFAASDHNIYALNAASGAEEWKFVIEMQGPSESAPVIANGVVYVDGENGNFYALNESDGSIVWQTPLHVSAAQTPAVDDGLVFAETGGTLTALDAATGATVWVANDGGNGEGDYPLAVANGVVYAMPLVAIDEASGQVLFQVEGSGIGSIVVANGDVYVNSEPTQLTEYSK